MVTKTKPYDAANYLNTDKDIIGFLEEFERDNVNMKLGKGSTEAMRISVAGVVARAFYKHGIVPFDVSAWIRSEDAVSNFLAEMAKNGGIEGFYRGTVCVSTAVVDKVISSIDLQFTLDKAA